MHERYLESSISQSTETQLVIIDIMDTTHNSSDSRIYIPSAAQHLAYCEPGIPHRFSSKPSIVTVHSNPYPLVERDQRGSNFEQAVIFVPEEVNWTKVTRSGRRLVRWRKKPYRRRVKLVKEKPAQSIEDKPAKGIWSIGSGYQDVLILRTNQLRTSKYAESGFPSNSAGRGVDPAGGAPGGG
ncbi:GDSL esterase/lipase-like [Dorcoceras hygrometricum]|uniref:GDSL esterase/lipase-like n=1 Tax=Dorcoceras hygrometricum TaxID=472368 RepID=A0A2Z7D5W5_9LAMI|nr:GDSL esterase/lipase-like [Dorcoceras hygrometricum]